MTLSAADRAKFELIARNALQRLATNAGVPVPRPEILWNMRGRSSMGCAIGYSVIRLHPGFAEAIGDEYADTVIHEACHIFVVAQQIRAGVLSRTSYRWSSHGGEWKRAMRSLGVRPERCGNLSKEVLAQVPPARTVRRVEATCNCAEPHKVTLVMARKVAHGGYSCRVCKFGVYLTDEARAVLAGVA